MSFMYSLLLPLILQSEGDILRNVHVGKQRIFLKDRINMPLIGCKVEVMSLPSNSTFPVSGVSNPPRIRSVVVFPHPEGPSRVNEFIFLDLPD